MCQISDDIHFGSEVKWFNVLLGRRLSVFSLYQFHPVYRSRDLISRVFFSLDFTEIFEDVTNTSLSQRVHARQVSLRALIERPLLTLHAEHAECAVNVKCIVYSVNYPQLSFYESSSTKIIRSRKRYQSIGLPLSNDRREY
jgi:hypothetical protein